MSWREGVAVALVVLAVLLVVPGLWMAFGWSWMMGPGMMGPGMMGRWGGWGWGGALGFLVLALLVVGAVLAILGTSRREPDGALEILRQRLARGEITPEQYEELRKLLR